MTQVSDTDLSIIIPVYQVSEELLLRCLKSVQEIQDLRKEVILVADGPDQEVCSNPAIQAFAGEAEFKISFYEKQHEGVSAARNYGIDHAGGTWIFFMDADDYICADAFRKVCPLLEKEEIYTDIDKCTSLTTEKAQIAADLEELYARWEELAE